MAEEESGNDSIEEQFEKWFVQRQDQEKKKAERNTPPKDFGDLLDRIADSVWERGEERAAARAQAADDADQPPSRGGKSSGSNIVEKIFGVSSEG